MLTLRRIREIGKADIGKEMTVRGWVRTIREQGAFSFVNITDGSNVAGIQIVLSKERTTSYADFVERIKTGTSVEFTGTLVESPAAGQAVELQAKRGKIYGDSPVDYPLQKKRHTLAFLRSIPHLRPRTNTISATMRVRNKIIYETHRFFQERGFFLISTPIITASDCEGAGELFRVTTLTPEQENQKTEDDFFERPVYLTVSGQLELESFACSMGNVYTLGPTFRAENSNTTRHLSEFWMVEPEMAFCDLDGDVEVATSYLKHLATEILASMDEEITFFERFYKPELRSRLESLASGKVKRITYTEAIEALQKSGRDFEFTPEWGMDLQSEHERYITEEYTKGVTVVTDYPKTIKPFYMKQNADGKTVAAMDILVPGVGEIIGGSQREDDYDKLKSAMLALNMNLSDYTWYLDLRKYGTVPHAGFGLGIERAVQYFTGIGNIRDVIPYPRFPGHV